MPPTARSAGPPVVDRRAEPDPSALLLDALPRAMVSIRDMVGGFARGAGAMLHFRVVTHLVDLPRTIGLTDGFAPAGAPERRRS